MEPSWGVWGRLGAVLGHLGAVLGPPGRPFSLKTAPNINPPPAAHPVNPAPCLPPWTPHPILRSYANRRPRETIVSKRFPSSAAPVACPRERSVPNAQTQILSRILSPASAHSARPPRQPAGACGLLLSRGRPVLTKVCMPSLKTPRNPHRNPQELPRTPSGDLQDAPRRLQDAHDGPKTPQDGPKRPPNRPMTTPRRSQAPPGLPQDPQEP